MVKLHSAPEQVAPRPTSDPAATSAASFTAGRVWINDARAGLRRLLKVRGAGLGLAVLVILVFLAIAAPIVSPYDPLQQDLLATLAPPSAAHPFGMDDLGRDVLARVIYGSRVSLEVGLIAIGVALLGGVIIGLAAGYFGGAV